MAYKKLSFVFICITLAAFVAVSGVNQDHVINPRSAESEKSHNLTIGAREQYARLVYQENIEKSSKLLRVVEVEKTFLAPSDDIITQVLAIDQKTNGNGAYAKIVKNGPGHSNVTLKFKSQRGHSIKFVVQIFAKPRLYSESPNSSGKSHNVTIGHREPNDYLVHQENIVESSSILRVLEIEKTFNTTNNDIITQILAIDQKTNGNGAYASLVKNGPGFSSATLKFTSQRGHGINFVVQVFAKPKSPSYAIPPPPPGIGFIPQNYPIRH